MDIELLRQRANIIREVRSFFDGREYLETDTPLLSPDLIPESCLEVFETALVPPLGSRAEKEKRYLIPSPEIWMKKLIAQHGVDIYQICKCFRNGESRGKLHSPEFTMLEYYTMDGDYLDSLKITEELFSHLLETLPFISPEEQERLKPPFVRISMEEAFRNWAGFSLEEAAEGGTLEKEARRLGIAPPPGLSPAALYDLIFIHAVEPSLPKERPAAILDYPAFVPCMARKKAGGKAFERWELYINGIELANCYSEEGDPQLVRSFFEAEGAEKAAHALLPHAVDGDYWKTFNNFPVCTGAALGLDRLIMALLGKSAIDGVLPFPFFAEKTFS
jgi:lysyl-tRNA synthetase class 2